MNLANELAKFAPSLLKLLKMYIKRTLEEVLKEKLYSSNKILILYGARQVGKTTLVKSILNETELKYLEVNADEKLYNDTLSSRDYNKLKMLVSGYDLLFIDEAQRIEDIGINLKILHDRFPELKIIVTGSSSFELSNRIHEPLTGRTWNFKLFPVAFSELTYHYNIIELDNRLEEFLIYGMYPEIFSLDNIKDKEQYLRLLTSSYLYKDVLEITSIKHSSKLDDLLRLLAFQVGSQVSLNELGRSLNMSKDTVNSYIDLLEKSFVIFRLNGYSKNLRKEVTKMDKIYFYDPGVRNAIINNFNTIKYRDDVGGLWENFLIAERMKSLHYVMKFPNQYFWRTYSGAELDYVEEEKGKLYGYEFKWGDKETKVPETWSFTYPDADFQCINLQRYTNFLLGR